MDRIVAKDIMTPEVIYFPEDFLAKEAAKIFLDKRISGAPIVDGDGGMVGMISLQDIALAAVQKAELRKSKDHDYYQLGWETPLSQEVIEALQSRLERSLLVRDIMTPMVLTIDEDTSLREIADTMIANKIHRLVVTDGEVLKGIVTTMDVIKAVRDHA